MKIKTSFQDELGTQIAVVEPGRGNWRVVSCCGSGHWGSELTGFNGETNLIILLTGWQSGDTDVTIVRCQVNDHSIVKQGRFSEANLDAGINRLIEETNIVA